LSARGAVGGDEIELELELKWSISGRPSIEAAEYQLEGDDLEEDESGEESPKKSSPQ
jgi:hypothetical protein